MESALGVTRNFCFSLGSKANVMPPVACGNNGDTINAFAAQGNIKRLFGDGLIIDP